MKAEERRNKILSILAQQHTALSATHLAEQLQVSRQIIVGDIALLRASGHEISATPRGYLLNQEPEGLLHRIACLHTVDQMEEELTLCIDQGCEVRDVIVEHPIYGQLTGQLSLRSRYDISQFMESIRNGSAHALSELTDGIHLHTLVCPSETAYLRVLEQLRNAGILLKEDV